MQNKDTPKIQRFDGHAHVFTTLLAMDSNRRYTPDKGAYTDDYLKLLIASQLDGALLIQPSFLGINNQFLLDVLSKNSHTPNLSLKGVVVLEPSTSVEYMQKLSAIGVVGIRLNYFKRALPDIYSKQWLDFFANIEKNNWHVEIHIEGHRLAPVLKQLCANVSKVVVDHFGLPSNGLLSKILTNPPHQGVFIKCSAPYRAFQDEPIDLAVKKCGDIVKQLIEARGEEYLIWGSDWPWTQHNNKQTFVDALHWSTLWTGSQNITSCWQKLLLK